MSNSAECAPRLIPAGRVARGRVVVPPSKSVSHRYLNLALLAGEPLHLERPLLADDTQLFLAALRASGFATQLVASQDSEVEAVELEPGPRPSGEIPIFCGNAGTMARFLVATLAAIPGQFRLDGTPRLRERTVGPLVDAVIALGGEIEYLGEKGFLPLGLRGSTLRGGRARLDAGSSSQFLSALLMAGARATGPIEIEVAALASAPYIDVTLALAREFGARIESIGLDGAVVYRVEPGLVSPLRARVEGDWSAAAYPAAAAALTGGEVRLAELSASSAQGDRRFIELLVEMGAEASWRDGELRVSGDGHLRGITADLSDIPDQVPTLAALAPFAAGETIIENVPHLRIKESDRLAAMARGLEAVGAAVTELPAGLVIPGVWATGVPPLEPAEIDPWDDHRIAMSFALLGLRRPGVSISEPAVVSKSYPDFWRDFESLLR